MSRKFKYLFIDLDGTLTRSRMPIDPQMKEMLETLPQTIIVVSGQPADAIRKQLGNTKVDYILGQNGNQAFKGDESLWCIELTDEERKEIFDHINYIESIRDWDVKDPDDLVEDRGSQISYSFIGHHEDIARKESFDPGGIFRKKVVSEHPRPLHQTEVKIAGTTSLDYFKKGSSKGSNIQKLIDTENWKNEECLYFGDSLYPGGNDEAVMGIITVQQVDDPKHLLKLLKEHYAGSGH